MQVAYLKALEEGMIQDRIKESSNQKDLDLATRRQVLLGTNQYPDATESFPEDLDTGIAFPANPQKTGHIVEPLRQYRGAMPFEELRVKTERLPEKPNVFLLTFGNPVWRKARAGFASGFFACAGYRITDNPGFATLDEGLEKALAMNASLVVLCSSDEEYRLSAPRALEKLDGKAILVVAGYPKDDIDELRGKGVKNFIHLRSNLLEELTRYHRLLGIE